jgi:hypothetical protein
MRENGEVTYKEVIAAAEAGCRGCKILQFALKPKSEEWGTQSMKLRIKQFLDETRICVETNSHSHGCRAAEVELYKLPGQDDGLWLRRCSYFLPPAYTSLS